MPKRPDACRKGVRRIVLRSSSTSSRRGTPSAAPSNHHACPRLQRKKRGGECRPFFSCHASPACPRAMTFRVLPSHLVSSEVFRRVWHESQSTTSSVYNVCSVLPTVASSSTKPKRFTGAPFAQPQRRVQVLALPSKSRSHFLLPTSYFLLLTGARAALEEPPEPPADQRLERDRTLTRSAKRRLRD